MEALRKRFVALNMAKKPGTKKNSKPTGTDNHGNNVPASKVPPGSRPASERMEILVQMRNEPESAKSNSSEKSISPLILKYQRILQESNGAGITADAKASTPFPSTKKKSQGNVNFGHKDEKKTLDSKPKCKVYSLECLT
ncbi:hypothetical protein PsorP6_002981 [Peronosclerospora sorghi]|uniref:Uncharacterized protein n=1 Tax=Peronosclerospora sorghi TaxID=230839 RepID=A0ACC0VJ88_9STRA|nr:hypothetical protein PsorP6_002981 [Peronosclerospora sorghi]